ncbi:MAG: hypothetical protein AVDCRST_MAG22-3341, partial [uncultured Rubrobacteraceae bacterium]
EGRAVHRAPRHRRRRPDDSRARGGWFPGQVPAHLRLPHGPGAPNNGEVGGAGARLRWGDLPGNGRVLRLRDSRQRGRKNVSLPRGRPRPRPLARAQQEPRPAPHPLGNDPPLLPALLLQRLRSIRRAARRLPRLPAPGYRPAPADSRRRPRPRDRQGDRRPARQRQQPLGPPPLRSRGLQTSRTPEISPDRLLPEHPRVAVPEERAV